MTGQCIEKLPHECGSSDGLQVFEGDGHKNYPTGYCFACDTYVKNPYNVLDADGKYGTPPNKAIRTQGEIDAELAEINSLPYRGWPERRLSLATMEYFGMRIGVSEQDGETPVFMYAPYRFPGRIHYKTRFIPDKKMWSVGSLKGADFFGWDQALAAGGKRLFITEGELDAASVYQVLKAKNKGSKWADLDPAVVSVSSGASSAAKQITDNLAAITKNFKEIVLVFDKDAAGKKATEDVLKILPTATTVDLPGKDPNDCIMNGRSKALANALVFKNSTPKNTRLVWGGDLHEAGRKRPTWGLSWPWSKLTQLTRGLRFSETYYLGAGVKMGKSELVNTLAAHLITEHGLKIFLAKPEETNAKTYQLVVGKVAGAIFHDPNVEFDEDAYDKASRLVGDNLCVLNLYQHLGWDSLRTDIMQAVAEGCRAVFIDPITNLTNGVGSGEANTILQEIAQELSAIAMDQEIMIFIFCHLKAPGFGSSHERGGKVESHQFSGSRAMMRSCNMMIGLEGNKDPDLELEQRNIRRLVILEDREFGATGVVPLYWDHKSGLFNQMEER